MGSTPAGAQTDTDTRSVRFGVWESLAIRLVRDEETGGSNPPTPTLVMHAAWRHLLNR